MYCTAIPSQINYGITEIHDDNSSMYFLFLDPILFHQSPFGQKNFFDDFISLLEIYETKFQRRHYYCRCNSSIFEIVFCSEEMDIHKGVAKVRLSYHEHRCLCPFLWRNFSTNNIISSKPQQFGYLSKNKINSKNELTRIKLV